MTCLRSYNSYPISILSWEDNEFAAFRETKKRQKKERFHS